MTDQPYQPPQADLGTGGVLRSSGHYEFNEAENLTIGKTAKRATIWGIASIVTGVVAAIGIVVVFVAFTQMEEEIGPGVPNTVILALIPLACVYLIIGWFYLGCGKAMKAVVETRGNDVELMMAGLAKMTGAFKAEAIVTIVAFAVGLVGGIVIAANQIGGM